MIIHVLHWSYLYFQIVSELVFLNVLFSRCGRGLCQNETESREYIKQKDPKLYHIINYVYLNNNDTKLANLGNCVTWTGTRNRKYTQLSYSGKYNIRNLGVFQHFLKVTMVGYANDMELQRV